MPSSSDLIAAIDAGDTQRVAALLAADRTLAATVDDEGVSAVMHARYRGATQLAEIVATHRPLDVFEAAALGRGDRLAELVAADPGLARTRSADGFTALHFAAFFGGGAVARQLLAAGADPNVRSENDFAVMPIHSAVAGRHADVVAALLEAGADPNVAQRHGYTPLHGAAENGDAETVEMLLTAGAERDTRDDEGRTPADLARSKSHAIVAERLAPTG